MDREVSAAKALATDAEVREHRIVRLPDLREASEIEGSRFPRMPGTYIPMRNSIFYSYASSYAEEAGADMIVGGHNRDDSVVFADARPEFFESLQSALRAGSAVLRGRRLRILRPLEKMTKPEVVRLAKSLGVPLHKTWSCHKGGTSHCWKCAGCDSRVAAFREAGLADPLRTA